MEDQGKRLLIAVAIAFGIMMLWQFVFPSKKPDKPEKSEATDAAQVDEREPASGGADTRPDTPPAASGAGAPVERGEEQRFEIDTPRFHAVLSSWGGVLSSFQLKGSAFIDRETNGPLDLVRTTPEEGLPFEVALRGEPGTALQIPPGAEWRGRKISDTEVSFSWESADALVEKHFRLHPEAFVVELTVDVKNKSARDVSQHLVVSLYGFEDPSRKTDAGMGRIARVWKSACMVGDEVEQFSAKSVIKRHRELQGEVRWAGFLHTYFLAGAAVEPDRDPTLTCRLSPIEGGRPGALQAELEFPEAQIRAGETYRRQIYGYMGPKYLDLLERISGEIGIKGTTGLEEAVDFGWLSFISRPLLWLLKMFQGFVQNWGIAIILLTFVVKLATLYWTHKSMKSMKEMAKLRPKMEAIREKYKDDKERQNIETMNLFKTHGVNPLSGCLPMLLQMPIWFALYRMLNTAAELYQAPFIPGWIDDLTLADPYFALPVLLTVMMFVQAKLTPATQTGMQQKMLQYGMPLMFGVFSFFFPAGLTLYILTNVVLTAVHHLVIHRDGRKEAKLAAIKGAVGGQVRPVIDVEAEEDEDGGEESDETSPASASKGGGSGSKGKKRKKGKRKR